LTKLDVQFNLVHYLKYMRYKIFHFQNTSILNPQMLLFNILANF